MNIVRRETQTPAKAPAMYEWDPFRMFRDMMRWDPFREMTPAMAPATPAEFAFVPNVDVKETKEAYIFKADLPGIKEKDLEVALTGNRLTIAGKREEEHREERGTYFTCERTYGTFTRAFTLPDGTQLDKALAELKDGVLTINIPKKAEVQPKRIPVTTTETPKA